jgi:hypothetical protein
MMLASTPEAWLMSRHDRVNSYSHSSWNKLVRVRFMLDVKKNISIHLMIVFVTNNIVFGLN